VGVAPPTTASPLLRFAEEVGDYGPVTAVGGRTQWAVGGEALPTSRLVRAPAGVLAVEPAEMTARAFAGTPVSELAAALAEVGQEANLPEPGPGATVGGVLAVGHSDVRRLGRGPIRDALLQVRYVSADGVVVTGGGPTVKNVTGYDLCRLVVGSLGTLGLLGEVILRTRPRPPATRWLRGDGDPFALREALFHPAAILWDGATTWCCLEGYPVDVEAEATVAARRGVGEEVEGPPALPPHRRSMRPRDLRALPEAGGSFVAEVGVGTVHVTEPPAPVPLDPVVDGLHQSLRAAFDPSGRLNPGRDPARR
jgi:glycolate oxidase FAD binding subunit